MFVFFIFKEEKIFPAEYFEYIVTFWYLYLYIFRLRERDILETVILYCQWTESFCVAQKKKTLTEGKSRHDAAGGVKMKKVT